MRSTPQFGSISDETSYALRPAAYVVVCSSEGQIAAVRGRRGYFLLGGGADSGESPEQTVEREVYEEIGCGITNLRRIGQAVQFFRASDGAYEMYAVFFEGELIGQPTESAEYQLQWISQDVLEQSMYHECHCWAVRQVLSTR